MLLNLRDVLKLIPHTSCKECGCSSCIDFALEVSRGENSIKKCSIVYEKLVDDIKHNGDCDVHLMVDHLKKIGQDDGSFDEIIERMNTAQNVSELVDSYFDYINHAIEYGYSDGDIIGGIMQNDEQNKFFDVDIREIIKVLISIKYDPMNPYRKEVLKSFLDEKNARNPKKRKTVAKTNLIINDQCAQCGICLGCGYDFLDSDEEGNVLVKAGTVLDKSSEEFKELQSCCPTDAFEIDESFDSHKILMAMIGELKNSMSLKIPTRKELKFLQKEYRIPLPVSRGENSYEYDSDGAANRAALREFERAMYSRMDSIILGVITDYRINRVKPYYTDKIEEGSVYAKNNRKVTELLIGINNILGNKIPDEMLKINVFPKSELCWGMLNKGEVVSDELVSCVKRELIFSASEYEHKWDTDYKDFDNGKNWRGEYKYKSKYCYKNLHNAFQDLAKDILVACGYANGDIEGQAIEKCGWLVEAYNEALTKEIETKLNKLMENTKDIIK